MLIMVELDTWRYIRHITAEGGEVTAYMTTNDYEKACDCSEEDLQMLRDAFADLRFEVKI